MRWSACAALVAAAVVLAAGCGGEENASARESCIAARENTAAAAALRRGYEQGLISRSKIERAPFFTRSDRLFDENGKLIPYDRLEGKTQARFDRFMASSAIRGELRARIAAARARAGEEAADDC
jgi:hypothetical protein